MGRFDWPRLPQFVRWISVSVGAAAIAAGVGFALKHGDPVACEGAGHACALPGAAVAKADAVKEAVTLPAGPVVVELTSEFCPACKQLEPVLKEAREQCKSAGAQLLQLDVESPEGGAWAAARNIQGTPTLILFDANHEEVSRVVGSQPLADVRRALEQAYGIACADVKPTGG